MIIIENMKKVVIIQKVPRFQKKKWRNEDNKEN